MSRLRRILGAIRGAVGWLNLPFDIQTLWDFFWRWIWPWLSASISALAVILLGYLGEAPFWQVAIFAILAFAVMYVLVFFLVWALRRSRAATAEDTKPPADDASERVVHSREGAPENQDNTSVPGIIRFSGGGKVGRLSVKGNRAMGDVGELFTSEGEMSFNEVNIERNVHMRATGANKQWWREEIERAEQERQERQANGKDSEDKDAGDDEPRI